MTLHIVPIEPIEERYSAQWLTWFDRSLTDHPSIPVEFRAYEPHGFLETGETVQIHRGEFLDVVNTNAYKAEQLQILCQAINNFKIKDGDIILFLDGWFPGLEMLAYIRDGLNLKIKIVGMFHSGTYDPHDFLTQHGMQAWGSPLENAWFTIYDQIIVATNYHKFLMTNLRRIDPNKIKVVFFPMLTDWIPSNIIKNSNQIVFPHRLAPEKCPNRFHQLQKLAFEDTVNFIMTKNETKQKSKYWELLASSKIAVSFALQETWGIAMIESVLCGCIPIVPNRCSYSELYPALFKYESSDNVMIEVAQVARMIHHFIKIDQEVIEELQKLKIKFKSLGMTSISTIVHHCFSQ